MRDLPRLLKVLALAALVLSGSGCERERRRFDDPRPPSPPRVPDPSAPRLPEPRTVGLYVELGRSDGLNGPLPQQRRDDEAPKPQVPRA